MNTMSVNLVKSMVCGIVFNYPKNIRGREVTKFTKILNKRLEDDRLWIRKN